MRLFHTISLLLLCLSTLSSYGQVSTAQPFPAQKCSTLMMYKLNYQPDSTNPGFRANEYMRLQIGKSISKFESEGTFLADSLSNTIDERSSAEPMTQEYVNKMMSLPTSRFGFKIYKDPQRNLLYSYDAVGEKLYRYTETLPLYKWKLLPDQSTIAGYKCQKATTSFAGRNYVAWFTRAIAIADGPYKFFGLPGLIIKVYDTRQQYVFELAKLTNVSYISSITPQVKTTIRTTKKEIHQAQTAYLANLPNLVAPLNPSEDKQIIRKRVKRMNNSIELY